jgi:hypothetical protein
MTSREVSESSSPPVPGVIQSKKDCYSGTGSDNYRSFRVGRIQGQIDKAICADDSQSQGANQTGCSADWSHLALPVFNSVMNDR